MTCHFLALELPDNFLNYFKKLHRPVEGVVWFGANPFVDVGWDEWGLLLLCDLRGSEENVGALDRRLQSIRLPALPLAMRTLTFWVAEHATDICLRMEPSGQLERLTAACLEAAGEAGMEASAFEPLVCLGQARGVSREALEAYALEVEPIGLVSAHPDRLVLCSRLYHGHAAARSATVQPSRRVLFEYRLQPD